MQAVSLYCTSAAICQSTHRYDAGRQSVLYFGSYMSVYTPLRCRPSVCTVRRQLYVSLHTVTMQVLNLYCTSMSVYTPLGGRPSVCTVRRQLYVSLHTVMMQALSLYCTSAAICQSTHRYEQSIPTYCARVFRALASYSPDRIIFQRMQIKLGATNRTTESGYGPRWNNFFGPLQQGRTG
jgi:hypothetical protein